MAKPSGAKCNLDCKYCFYLEKEGLYPSGSHRMTDEVLEAYVRGQIESQPAGAEVLFAWQGGEPTLMGVPFFEKAVALQKELGRGRRIANAFQTNGVLLDDVWGEFLRRENFLVGLSIDGPRDLHDLYRVDKGGRPTFDNVLRGLEVLKRHRVDFNTLTVVHRESARRPLEVYEFLKSAGSTHLQFIPLVERVGEGEVASDASVLADDWGSFLTSIWDQWVTCDVGKVFVQLFDVMLGVWMGQPSGLCLFRETCGDAVAMEHNGDIYSCDHFVTPRHRLGNLLDKGLGDMVRDAPQRLFGTAKVDTLPRYCRECEVRFACHGECPKNRFIRTPDGEPGLNYLCTGYKHFFKHANPGLRGMAWLAMNRESPAKIMEVLSGQGPSD
ncbi:anaerobic sulfatase maturase [Roseimicrobium sp. ORNL1]|uniref:anaerobic sulfatase maturase n=1 Tax=Roseimicrobium sp. ORNL1 TaxID=2711231 RepID=UPI00197E6E76|nr:anaerobic sulfatase maturase [Roseimicrobium sp. ORNL1]